MKVRLITPRNLTEFAKLHSGSDAKFEKFLSDLGDCDWETPNDIKGSFNSADIIGENRVVFDVGGNSYRVICKYVVKSTEFTLYLKWVGTHADYDRLCKKGEQYNIDSY